MSLAPGTAFGPYEILSLAGAGGMGEVYRARDSRLDRHVAIKVLPPQLGHDADALGRFMREARTLSQLTHPNICTVYDVGREGATHYIVMEFLEGRTLAAYLGQGPLPVGLAIDYALQIADGLSKAHALGVIHRDLKPANVMLTGDGFVKILDFGLSKRFHAAENDATALLTATSGLVVGTIAYMAPEQTQGARADVRSDIFSFGVTLYEMLTGVRPFDGANVVSTIRRINDEEARPLREVRPEIPQTLEAIIAKALRKNAQQRFQSVSELRSYLRAVVASSSSSAALPLPPLDGDAAHTADAKVPWLAWRHGVVAALVVGVVVAALLGFKASRGGGAGAVTGGAADLAALPNDAVQLARRGQALLQRYDRPQNVEQAIGIFRDLVARDASNALAYAGLSEAYLRKDGMTPDPQWRRLAGENGRRAVELNGDLAVAHLAQAVIALREGRRPEALQSLNHARDLEPRNSEVLRAFGDFYQQEDPIKAGELYRAAVAAAPDDWRVHQSMGRWHYGRSEFADAIREWELARTSTPDNVNVLRNLGAVYHMVDRTDDAATVLQRALEIEPQATTYNNLGTLRFFQGRYGDAAATFDKAVSLNPTYFLYWGNLGDAYRWSPGREQQAKEAYTRAIALAEERLKANPKDMQLAATLAGYLAKRGDREQATEHLRAIAKEAAGNPNVSFQMAIAYEVSGDRDAALHHLEDALTGGYSMREIANDAELVKLRTDARYHRLLARHSTVNQQ